MGEKWVHIKLSGDETLRCHSCCAYVHNQIVPLYLNVNDEIEEVICSTCWKENQKGRSE